MKTEIKLADFIAAHKIGVRFVPLHAAQEQESEFKTWQLHYSAVVTVGGKSEMFSWSAGYGCALHDERVKHAVENALRPSFSAPFNNTIGGKILTGTSASKFINQAEVGKFMAFLLARYVPAPEDLINGLKLDASLGEQSFHDFCGDIGADEDSRKSEASWRECQESGRKLRGLIGHAAFAELLNNTESL